MSRLVQLRLILRWRLGTAVDWTVRVERGGGNASHKNAVPEMMDHFSRDWGCAQYSDRGGPQGLIQSNPTPPHTQQKAESREPCAPRSVTMPNLTAQAVASTHSPTNIQRHLFSGTNTNNQAANRMKWCWFNLNLIANHYGAFTDLCLNSDEMITRFISQIRLVDLIIHQVKI